MAKIKCEACGKEIEDTEELQHMKDHATGKIPVPGSPLSPTPTVDATKIVDALKVGFEEMVKQMDAGFKNLQTPAPPAPSRPTVPPSTTSATDEIDVPDVTETLVDEAEKRLKDLGVKVKIRNDTHITRVQPGYVNSQDKTGSARKGDTVTLRARPKEIPESTGNKQDWGLLQPFLNFFKKKEN